MRKMKGLATGRRLTKVFVGMGWIRRETTALATREIIRSVAKAAAGLPRPFGERVGVRGLSPQPPSPLSRTRSVPSSPLPSRDFEVVAQRSIAPVARSKPKKVPRRGGEGAV